MPILPSQYCPANQDMYILWYITTPFSISCCTPCSNLSLNGVSNIFLFPRTFRGITSSSTESPMPLSPDLPASEPVPAFKIFESCFSSGVDVEPPLSPTPAIRMWWSILREAALCILYVERCQGYNNDSSRRAIAKADSRYSNFR